MTQRKQATSKIKAAYDDWAEFYDVDANSTRDLNAAVLRRQPLALGNRSVLEFGCGTGLNAAWLVQQSRCLIAMDLSEGMLKRASARVKSPHVGFVRHDITEPWPFEANTFDLVVGNLVLEHIADLHHVFAEAYRVLRLNGELYICELHPFRQLRGAGAQFVNPETGERTLLPCFVHDIAEYINTGLGAGFYVRQVGEWRDDEGAPEGIPRLFSVLFSRRKNVNISS
jgi:ubiquinone/menaquinone biosynthesis C-methylase UbiE